MNNSQLLIKSNKNISLLVETESYKKTSINLGGPDEVFTPLYWKYICEETNAIKHRERYKLGGSLLEEIIACILGGYGIKGELGNKAFYAIKDSGLLNCGSSITVKDIETILKKPINISGRSVHYRFPNQKAKYIEKAINYIKHEHPPNDNCQLMRNWLLKIPGVGLKTASWISRNWMDADDVAILDIHVHRAGVLMDLFSSNEDLTKHYLKMESRFIQLAKAIEVPTSVLDNIIWTEIRQTPSIVRRCLIEKNVKSNDKCGLPSAKNRYSNSSYSLFV